MGLNISISSGATRVVILAGIYAIKIPRMTEWRLILHGLLANMQESKFSGLYPELCPVRFSIPGGFLIVMDRAEPVGEGFQEQWKSLPICIRELGESKPDNYGLINGRLVAIDYGS